MKPTNNNNNNDKPSSPSSAKNEYQQILKKIQTQSKQQKQQRTINIMRGQTSKNKPYQSFDLFKTVNAFLNQRKDFFKRYYMVKQNRHTAIMTAFLIFSSYIAWKIEKKYDGLKKRAQRTQTYKQRQVQQQNDYIQRMLKKKQFQSVPIPTQLQQSNKYKFEEHEQKGGLVIDTKEDLMELIEKDNSKGGSDKKKKRGGSGMTPEQIYQEEVRRTREAV